MAVAITTANLPIGRAADNLPAIQVANLKPAEVTVLKGTALKATALKAIVPMARTKTTVDHMAETMVWQLKIKTLKLMSDLLLLPKPKNGLANKEEENLILRPAPWVPKLLDFSRSFLKRNLKKKAEKEISNRNLIKISQKGIL